jgi:hypothetical protein
MLPKRHRSRAAVLLAGLTATALACGGVSTQVDRDRIAEQNRILEDTIESSTDAWVEWRDSGGKFVEIDFINCYEINNVPRPAVEPPEDPSGHSRSRRGCDQAVAQVKEAMPDFERLAVVPDVSVPEDSPLQAEYDSLKEARSARLKWARDIIDAWQTQDMPALRDLIRRASAIARLESQAITGRPLP